LSLLFFSFVHAFLCRSCAHFMEWLTHSTAAASFLCLAEEVSRSCGGLTPSSGARSRGFSCCATGASLMRVQVRMRRLPRGNHSCSGPQRLVVKWYQGLGAGSALKCVRHREWRLEELGRTERRSREGKTREIVAISRRNTLASTGDPMRAHCAPSSLLATSVISPCSQWYLGPMQFPPY